MPDSFGGIESFIRDLATSTSRRNVQNTLLVTSKKPQQSPGQNYQFDIIRSKMTFEISSCPVSISFLHQFQKLVQQADILHVHFPWPYADFTTLLFATSKPIVVTYQSDIVKQRFLKHLYHPLMQRFLSRADQIIVTSENYLHSSKTLAQFYYKCRIIPLSIDMDYYGEPCSEKTAEWNNRVGNNFLLFIGKFRHYKGLETLLNAMKGITNIPLVLIGEGVIEPKLKDIAKRHNLTNIYFVGPVPDPDKIALIKLSRAVILPSSGRSESFGIALLEGLAYGKPLISTEIETGTSYINQHGITGLVVPPNDSAALRLAIMTLFQNNILAHTMGSAARLRFLEYFSLEKITDQYMECYTQLCRSRINKTTASMG